MPLKTRAAANQMTRHSPIGRIISVGVTNSKEAPPTNDAPLKLWARVRRRIRAVGVKFTGDQLKNLNTAENTRPPNKKVIVCRKKSGISATSEKKASIWPSIASDMTLGCHPALEEPAPAPTTNYRTLCDLDTQQTVHIHPVSCESQSFNTAALQKQQPNRQSRNFRTVSPSEAHVHCIRQSVPVPVKDSTQPTYQTRGSHSSVSALPQPALSRPVEADTPNLMWLLDYRLDHLMEPAGVNDRSKSGAFSASAAVEPPHQLVQHVEDEGNSRAAKRHRRNDDQTCCTRSSCWLANQIDVAHEEEVTDTPNAVEQGYFSRNAVKPPCTYTELIEQALLEQGELTVSGIYNWITTHFVYYQSCDDRWKNSVRHNLSMNPYFRKGSKSKSGNGHLWVLANVGDRLNSRRSMAARMGRPFRHQTFCDEDEDAVAGIRDSGQDIWLSSAAENNRDALTRAVDESDALVTSVDDSDALVTAVDETDSAIYLQATDCHGGVDFLQDSLNLASETIVDVQEFTLDDAADRILHSGYVNPDGSQVEVQFLLPSHTRSTIHHQELDSTQLLDEFHLSSVIQA